MFNSGRLENTLVRTGIFVLEGTMYPNTEQADSSITKEFLKFDNATKEWKQFFIGVARKSVNK
ncbi:hypothetical protein GCM10011613_31930 [Cellvibrio zantedeschiae]|uniref:Uncharacterized protein n=1 Tax=Cellvibrio zantedeschiae TaxID=1237077 RepID=A0ABQ3B8H5_9GAMM|nr:hypothetical protein GCM10011613_31930 [Cellvibrio zantedeschiae]